MEGSADPEQGQFECFFGPSEDKSENSPGYTWRGQGKHIDILLMEENLKMSMKMSHLDSHCDHSKQIQDNLMEFFFYS